MATKIRKQIYIEPEQEELLKRLAHDTGMSEAQIIRQAIDRHANELSQPARRERAWAEILAFINKRMEQGPVPGERAPEGPRTWRREDLYDR
jgi:hypothetical protein